MLFTPYLYSVPTGAATAASTSRLTTVEQCDSGDTAPQLGDPVITRHARWHAASRSSALVGQKSRGCAHRRQYGALAASQRVSVLSLIRLRDLPGRWRSSVLPWSRYPHLLL